MDDFELMECIDEGLNLFGSNIRYTIYWRMTILNNIPREGILVNPESFIRGIESIFGAGASRIEAAIVDKIKRRFNLQTLETTSFPELIHQIKIQSRWLEQICPVDKRSEEMKIELSSLV